jgi:hypothetical protein
LETGRRWIMSTSLNAFYRVGDDDRVTLKITIGHGQTGTSFARLGEEVLASEHPGKLERALPGTGRELRGKVLQCRTTVADIREETNKTSVTYELKGGLTRFEQTLEESVERERDSIRYKAIFNFSA